MRDIIDVRRLAEATAVVAILFIPAYFLLLRADEPDAATSPARLLDTQTGATASKVGLEPGELAPDFEISTTDGRRIRLSDFRGRPVVLNFFALWCISCLTEMPEIKAALEERGLESFAVLAINAGESRERALEFVDFLDAPFTYGLDTTLVVSDAYRVYGLPASVFIDSDGVIRAVYAGYTGRDRLNVYLDGAINARPPGDLPIVLRLISTIPRDRTLVVQLKSEHELKLTSRSLRCDAGYCAEAAIGTLKQFAAIREIDTRLEDANPSINLHFDPAKLTREQIVDAMVQALESLADPVYQGPVEVTYSES
jgi:peroxiredoxin